MTTASPSVMTCAEIEPLLPLVADGAIDPDSDPGVFAHLSSCPACQRLIADHDLVTLALELGSRQRVHPSSSPFRMWTPVAIAAGLLLAGSWAWWSTTTTPSEPPITPATASQPTIPPAPEPTIATEVIRMFRSDGSSYYLVRRNGTWQSVDPNAMDGFGTVPRNSDDGVPIHFQEP